MISEKRMPGASRMDKIGAGGDRPAPTRLMRASTEITELLGKLHVDKTWTQALLAITLLARKRFQRPAPLYMPAHTQTHRRRCMCQGSFWLRPARGS